MSGVDPRRTRIEGIFDGDTSRLHGDDARTSNIAAGRALADIVQTTLGPRGMDKMVVDDSGRVTVTNDGVTILRELDVVNPAAEMLVEVAETQETEVGDGTTTAVVLAGALLTQADDLIDRGVEPATVIDGFRLAGEFAMDEVSALAAPVASTDEAALRQVAATSLSGTRTDSDRDRVARLVVDTVRRSAERGGVDRERTHVEAWGERGDSRVVDGIVVRKHPVHEAMPHDVDAANVLVLNSPLELQFERKEELHEDVSARVTGPEALARLAEHEQARLDGMVDRVLDLGTDVVFCAEGVDPLVGFALARNDVFAVEFTSDEDVERLPGVTGAAVSDLETASTADLGHADLTYHEAFESVVVQHPDSPHVTLCCHDPGLSHRKEFERTVTDAVDVVSRALVDEQVVPGGGATEMALAKAVRTFAGSMPGRKQLAAMALADALEVVPRTLASTAGMDPVDVLIELRTAHDAGRTGTGIDATAGACSDVRAAGVLEPAGSKRQAVGSAVEAANAILKIDDVISSNDLEIDPEMNTLS